MALAGSRVTEKFAGALDPQHRTRDLLFIDDLLEEGHTRVQKDLTDITA
jgi:hypoxanthine-guanine phosphoribosyltransferase